MKKTLSLMTVIAAIALVSFTLATATTGSAAAPSAAPAWEHLAFPVDAGNGVGDGDTGRQIIQLGADGWELVDVETTVRDGTTTRTIYFFKRQKS